MGELLRRFWMPALLSEELPERDGPPKKIKILGEDLLAFRADRRPGRHRRAALPASRRQSLLRPQRGVRPALLLPRLEVRRRRQLRRPADLAAGVGLQGHDQAARLSDARMGRHDLGLHGPARDDAGAAAARARPGARRLALRHQEVAGLQLGAEPRRRDRHLALLLPAQGAGDRRARPRASAMAKAALADQAKPDDRVRWVQNDPRPTLQVLGHDTGLVIGGGRKTDGARSLLAHRAVPDAQPRLHARRLPRRDLLRPVAGCRSMT